jgi:hypothetical protein
MGQWRYSARHSLTSALDEGEWSASRPGRFTPRERAPGTHWIGGWVGPGAVLDAVVKRNISLCGKHFKKYEGKLLFFPPNDISVV